MIVCLSTGAGQFLPCFCHAGLRFMRCSLGLWVCGLVEQFLPCFLYGLQAMVLQVCGFMGYRVADMLVACFMCNQNVSGLSMCSGVCAGVWAGGIVSICACQAEEQPCGHWE